MPLVRRRGCIFAPTSVVPEDGGERPPEESDSASSSADYGVHMGGVNERRSMSGELHSGESPQGGGRTYTWADGRTYEGEWLGDVNNGRGRFVWPSGATYEGEFKDGFMDGLGTYVGVSGNTYRGHWSMNLKHGRGRECYANGDCYDGEWRAGEQEGGGKYMWRNGNEYAGEWRAGMMHGKGVMRWATGERYEGGWENGEPMGVGSFWWPDGGVYVGVWRRRKEEGEDCDTPRHSGVFYPAPGTASPMPCDPEEVFDARLARCTVCASESLPTMPTEKLLDWSSVEAVFLHKQAAWRRIKALSAAMANTTRDDDESPTSPTKPSGHPYAKFDSRECSSEIENGGGEDSFITTETSTTTTTTTTTSSTTTRSGSLQESMSWHQVEDVDPSTMSHTAANRAPTMMKQGVSISKGHKNYDLMLNLQLGIRHTLGKQSPSALFELKASAFDPREKHKIRFPPEGSKHTPPHQSCEFKWKDYCPLVFRTLRQLFKVSPEDYMISLCGNSLRELSSPGKSGSAFYLTHDDRYMIKTMKKAEMKVVIKILHAYYNHVRAYENTLVTRFFGVHSIKQSGTQKKVRFVIMGNVFCSEYPIHRRFDLKGSSLGRTIDQPQETINEHATLKDLDLNLIFRLPKGCFQEFRRQIDRDCEFLEQEKIMDYSLLAGLHFRDPSSSHRDSHSRRKLTRSWESVAPRRRRPDADIQFTDPTRWTSRRLGDNTPAKAERVARQQGSNDTTAMIGDPTGEIYDAVISFGIIDILQEYDISKKIEHAYKAIHYDPAAISAVDPKLYSRRFRDFIFKVFTDDSGLT